jgi:hypothetical protein
LAGGCVQIFTCPWRKVFSYWLEAVVQILTCPGRKAFSYWLEAAEQQDWTQVDTYMMAGP